MDSAYLVAGVAVAALAIYFTRYELNRHKKANLKLREIHAQHLSMLRADIVQRLGLRYTRLTPPDNAIYSRVAYIYDQPDLMVFPQRVAWARQHVEQFDAEAIVYYWTVGDASDLDDDELFALWYGGVLAPIPEIAAALMDEIEKRIEEYGNA